MPIRWEPREHLRLAQFAVRWLLLCAPMAAFTGVMCAAFLWSLEWATGTREMNPWLLFLLPVAGVALALGYAAIGKNTERGNNLLIDEIHQPGGGLPRRMAPLILVSTVISHLFGASVGREGTAVQMGGSIASGWGRLLRLSPESMRLLLMAGIAAGFGGVFGTPLAGAVFAMEVLVIGQLRYTAIVPCLLSGIIGDQVSRHVGHWIGVQHQDYHQLVAAASVDGLVLLKVAGAGIIFGLVSVLFAEGVDAVRWVLAKTIRPAFLRPALGGAVIIGLVYAIGTRDYLGLGVTAPAGHASIFNSFHAGLSPWSWFWKLVFTVICLGSGFKGGEVTPLFFIGAALGNALAWLMGAPVELFAALGLVAVFAGATNTPLACTIMGLELFGLGRTDGHEAGGAMVIYLATACFLAYFFSGHSGIYSSQRIGVGKGGEMEQGLTLKAAREGRRAWFRRKN